MHPINPSTPSSRSRTALPNLNPRQQYALPRTSGSFDLFTRSHDSIIDSIFATLRSYPYPDKLEQIARAQAICKTCDQENLDIDIRDIRHKLLGWAYPPTKEVLAIYEKNIPAIRSRLLLEKLQIFELPPKDELQALQRKRLAGDFLRQAIWDGNAKVVDGLRDCGALVLALKSEEPQRVLALAAEQNSGTWSKNAPQIFEMLCSFYQKSGIPIDPDARLLKQLTDRTQSDNSSHFIKTLERYGVKTPQQKFAHFEGEH